MEPIQFTSTCYTAGGKPIYLLSGEFHYFRVPKADWRRRMRLFREAGGNCLATYVPWLLHEPEEGSFRFQGEDWLDLEGFLLAANAEGLYVIARPGPYQYSELIFHGLPGWLVQNYPEVLAQTVEGKPIGYASISYTHPLFLEKVRAWFQVVCPILARFTIENGGPVALVQIDNEMVGIHEWFGSLDYHPTSMGIGQPGGKYPQFLEQRYPDIGALNDHYGTNFDRFSAVRPKPELYQPALGTIRQKKDYFDFYLGTISEYAQALVDMLTANGIHTPIVHNAGNPGMNAYFLETARRLGDRFLLGSDHYYNLDQNWPQNNPTPQYAARCFLSLEMLRLMGFPPTVFEIPGGSASDWPPVTPQDALAAYMTNLAYGMKGSNYYIFTGGPNPPGAGNTTDLYDYGAGISAGGETRPLYQAQKAFGQFIQNQPGWLESTRLSDFRIAMDMEYARSEQYWNERGPFLVSNPEAWQLLRRGILTTALCASLSPAFIDLAGDAWVADTATPLVIACSASMGLKKQQRVVDFLKNGGRAVIAPLLPSLDENLRPCTVLADFLGAPRQVANQAGLARPRIAGIVNVSGVTFPFEHVPAGAAVTGVDEYSCRPIAISISTEGNGQAVVLGLNWTHAMREHERMLTGILNSLGLEQALVCSNPNLWATCYPGEGSGLIFLLNLFTVPQEASMQYRSARGGPLRELGHVRVEPMSVLVKEIAA